MVISRAVGEGIVICGYHDADIVVMVKRIDVETGVVELEINAPRTEMVLRGETYERLKADG